MGNAIAQSTELLTQIRISRSNGSGLRAPNHFSCYALTHVIHLFTNRLREKVQYYPAVTCHDCVRLLSTLRYYIRLKYLLIQNGRANTAKATYAFMGVVILYLTLKPKSKK
ncbi:unnamed protein product [Arctia plantaginis]|uniref:Uncharacterized protein n=1 Tax=Arctia plantaginis TaxID=874455 RepID=A0A8S1BJ99_ARCPL|nr:unnamed protein product [Arctia plantaginis]